MRRGALGRLCLMFAVACAASFTCHDEETPTGNGFDFRTGEAFQSSGEWRRNVTEMPMTNLHLPIFAIPLLLGGCASRSAAPPSTGAPAEASNDPSASLEAGGPDGSAGAAALPLVTVADVNLPGPSSRFDYQDVDTSRGQLIIAHMNNASVLVTSLRDGSVLKELSGIPTPRGVVAASDIGRIFVTSSPNQLVIIDAQALTEVKRVTTGHGPDGVAWDPAHRALGVSDQGDGALSIVANAGDGPRTQVHLGTDTGNVVYDAARGWFWITVVPTSPPDKLVAVDPTTAGVVTSIDLPGCDGAHGLRLHPDGRSAFIACESNDVLARVDLEGSHAVATGTTGSGPDVLSIDPGLGWLYVAAESGDLTVFDIRQPGVALLGHDHPGANSHTVAVDPTTHRVFFPLMAAPAGTPVLRIMRPSGL